MEQQESGVRLGEDRPAGLNRNQPAKVEQI
jgi:hypothetical protein